MNIYTPEIDRKPSREEAEAALAVLRQWAGKSSDDEIARLDASVGYLVPGQGYPVLARVYPGDFAADAAYRATLPDLQNGPASLIRTIRSFDLPRSKGWTASRWARRSFGGVGAARSEQHQQSKLRVPAEGERF